MSSGGNGTGREVVTKHCLICIPKVPLERRKVPLGRRKVPLERRKVPLEDVKEAVSSSSIILFSETSFTPSREYNRLLYKRIQ